MKKKVSVVLAFLLMLSLMVPVFASAENVSLAYKSGALNLRKGPSVSYKSMGTVHDGDHISIVERGSVWTKVKTDDNKTGYIKNLYILDGNKQYASGTKYFSSRYTAYTTGSVNFRAGASTNNAVMETKPKGTRVTVLGSNGDFYLVKDGDGHQGFLSKKLVSKAKVSAPDKDKKDTMKVAGDYVNMRERGTIKSDVLMVLRKNTTVEVLFRGNYWTRVEYKGTEGWIKNTLLK